MSLRILRRPEPRSPGRLQAVPLSVLRDLTPVSPPAAAAAAVHAALVQVEELSFILLPFSGFLTRVSWILTISRRVTPAGRATRADAAKSEEQKISRWASAPPLKLFFLCVSGVHLVTRATLSCLMENVFLTVSTDASVEILIWL